MTVEYEDYQEPGNMYKNSDKLLLIQLKIYGTYIYNQKFHSIRNSVLHDAKKNYKKINLIKDVKNIYFAL